VSTILARIGTIAAAVVLASTTLALAETQATPAPKSQTHPTLVAQESATPSPKPSPFTWSGDLRAYYFTRQNATNYPGVQFNFTPGAKYNSNAVNQASFMSGVNLHADYHFPDLQGWYIGAGYFYGNPWDGQCVTPANHAKGAVCVTQIPPNTNPDDTLPAFQLSTFDEAYLGWQGGGFNGKVGNFLEATLPWMDSWDATRVKPAAYQGFDLDYNFTGALNGLQLQVADAFQYQNRTSGRFTQQTLLTSFPAGGGGLASNIASPDGLGINTNGTFVGRATYSSQPSYTDGKWTVDGEWYSAADIYNMYWGDGQYTWTKVNWSPFLALQGGWEANQGLSVVGKINSSDIGAQVGATPYKGKYGSATVTFGFDDVPWQSDTYTTASLAAYGECNTTTNTWKGLPAKTFGYFLPNNVPDCSVSGANTSIYYGGWASAYTDNYATDPFFTTSISQGMVDRRSPGLSYKGAVTWWSPNDRIAFIASDAWYQYGNAITQSLPQFSPYTSLSTNEWDLDGRYYFSENKPNQHYHGLLFRYRYMQRTIPDTYFASGSTWLGGIPLFKYNRAQIEYDF
jgi:hypothetical protein